MISAVNRKKTFSMKAWLLVCLLLCMTLYILGAFLADIGSFGIPKGWLLAGQNLLIGITVNLGITLVFSEEKKRLKVLFSAAAFLEILICLWLHFSPPLGKLPFIGMAAELLGNGISALLILTLRRFTREKASF